MLVQSKWLAFSANHFFNRHDKCNISHFYLDKNVFHGTFILIKVQRDAKYSVVV